MIDIQKKSINYLLEADLDIINEAMLILGKKKSQLEYDLFEILASKDMASINKNIESIEKAILYNKEIPASIRIKLIREQTYTIEDFEYIKLIRELLYHNQDNIYSRMVGSFVNQGINSDNLAYYELVKKEYNSTFNQLVEEKYTNFFQGFSHENITRILTDPEVNININHNTVEKAIINSVNNDHSFLEYLLKTPKYKNLFSDKSTNNNYVKNALLGGEGEIIEHIANNLINVSMNLNDYDCQMIRKALIETSPEKLNLIFSNMKFNAVFLTEFMEDLSFMNSEDKIDTWNVFTEHLIKQDDYNIEQCLNHKNKKFSEEFILFIKNIEIFHNLNKTKHDYKESKGLKL